MDNIPPIPGKATPPMPNPKFKASRIVKEKDGSTNIEVDLHNRLPVWANYQLNRELSEIEQKSLERIPGNEFKPFAHVH
jgi:hypothetical protein